MNQGPNLMTGAVVAHLLSSGAALTWTQARQLESDNGPEWMQAHVRFADQAQFDDQVGTTGSMR